MNSAIGCNRLVQHAGIHGGKAHVQLLLSLLEVSHPTDKKCFSAQKLALQHPVEARGGIFDSGPLFDALKILH